MRREAIKVLFVRLFDEHLHLLAVRRSLEVHHPLQFRSLAHRAVRHRHPIPVERPQVFEDDPLRLLKLNDLRLVLKVRAVRAMHRETPGAAGAEVELVNGVGETFRPPPFRQLGWIAERFEQPRRRGVE